MQLSAVYITALSAGRNFTDQRFPRIVSDADLSCPLDHAILDKACAELTRRKTDKARYKNLTATA